MADTLNGDGVVTVDGETTVLQTSWTETSDGEYEATYQAVYKTDNNTNLKATLALGWTKTVTYSISVGAQSMDGTISAGGKYDFPTIGNQKFPTTAFNSAAFRLNSDNFSAGGGASHYALKVTCGGDTTKACGWVTATADGSEVVVIFTSSTVVPVANRNVRITATPDEGSGSTTVLKYEFTVKKWFQYDRKESGSFEGLALSCQNDGGKLPTPDDLSPDGIPQVQGQSSPPRKVGALWPEWGTSLHVDWGGPYWPGIWSGGDVNKTEDIAALEIINKQIYESGVAGVIYPGSMINTNLPLARICRY